MIPVVFENCFGWFHPPPSDRSGGTAVLLCPGASQDFSNGYRPFRLLAEHLAEAGYPTLRFDYPGTGDSADPESNNLWEVWQQSISRAATWLRGQTRADKLLLIGLRIGGTLAAVASEQLEDIAGLILIEPCQTGRSYVSQLTTEARLRGAQQPEADLEVGELYLTSACIHDMRKVELVNLALPLSLPVAIFSRVPEEKLRIRLAAWCKRSINFTYEDLSGLEAMLRPSHHYGEPELDATRLLIWLHCNIPPSAPSHASLPLPKPEAFILPNCIETSLSFGSFWRLNGILSRPRINKYPGFSVLICNSGGNPRHGFARFGVECARSLAEAGIASLRFDFAGLGDSIHYSDGTDLQTDPFTEDRTNDISEALDTLEALGFTRFALHGLCSGAYHALRGACTQKRIVQLISVNLPWFSLQPEKPGPGSSAQNCLRTLIRRDIASLFLFGQQDTGLKQFERHFGADGRFLPDSPVIELCVLPELDHELTVGWMRRQVAERIINFVRTHQTGTWLSKTEGEPRYGHA
ncbi:MAG: hypothetical protein KGK02_01170 [Rhodospirillales bacterium]|nr:hypothetical protein [Rhodospirillales bacterium]